MKNYITDKRIHPCRLNRADLVRLVALIKTDFSKSERKEDFELRSYFDGLNISENSLDAFFHHTDLPPVLSRLTIRQIGWSAAREIDKLLELTFYDNYISLSVRGESESWVKGKSSQLLDFLKTKRPFFWFLRTRPGLFFGGALIFIIGGPALGFIEYRILTGGFISVGIFLPMGVIFLILLGFAVARFRYTQIYLTRKNRLLKNTIP
jgi:hypothetical protein